ncbi:hypothetical protein BTO05_08600 [Winogradskyella sp. PC-19]|nr:hypothetical protein BTO05_08600 [Winogradskyella sp. PC-19]
MFSCNSEKKKEEEKPIMKIVETEKPKEEIKPITTLLEYINSNKKSEEARVDKAIGEVINIAGVSVFQEPTTRTYAVVRITEDLPQVVKDNYVIILRTYPSDLEDLTDYIKTNKPGLNFDTWYIKDLTKTQKGANGYYYSMRLSDNTLEFDKIVLQLYDKRTEKIVQPEAEVELY